MPEIKGFGARKPTAYDVRYSPSRALNGVRVEVGGGVRGAVGARVENARPGRGRPDHTPPGRACT